LRPVFIGGLEPPFCACPIRVQGSLGGEYVRQTLNLTVWGAAQEKVRGREASGQLGVIMSEIPTATEAIAKHVADAVARNLAGSAQRAPAATRTDVVTCAPLCDSGRRRTRCPPRRFLDHSAVFDSEPGAHLCPVLHSSAVSYRSRRRRCRSATPHHRPIR